MKNQLVHVGTIGRPHGIRGQVRVFSHTQNPEDLNQYGELIDDCGDHWTLDWCGDQVAILINQNGKALDNRNSVEKLTNRKLFVPRDRFPKEEEDEFYLVDLIGLQAKVKSEDNQFESFGKILSIHDYGAGSSLEIEQTTGTMAGHKVYIPFTKLCVPIIEIDAGWVGISLPEEIETRLPSKHRGIS
ncbi:MAG: ribosome maturation factor RimM [Commensalibacter sp.]|nr:ribosome maturation factor RimM [Commensalibacter sp.]